MNRKKISVIIPCAGHNKKKGLTCAKSLIHLPNNEYLLERQVRIIRERYGNPEIIVTTGFQSEKVMSIIPNRVKVVENECFENTSVVKSIDLAMNYASYDDLVIIYGDTVFNPHSLPKIDQNSSVIIDSTGQMKEDEIGINIIDKQAIYFSYGFRSKWTNIIHLGKNDINKFRSLVSEKENKKLFTFEILNKMIHKGCYIECIEPKNMKVVKIDTPKDIEAARIV